MKIQKLNKDAWDKATSEGTNPYTKVVSRDQIVEARQGSWSLFLSDCKPVPKEWFPDLNGLKVLCLASGGGQQAPIFAALGAEVTLLDASPRQLAQDQFVAERDNLVIKIIEGDMADLSAFKDESFDFVVKHSLPYVEHETLSREVLEERIRNKEMFHFSHTMEAQLGGLTKAGFVIIGFYEDRRPEEDGNPIRHYMPSYYVIRVQKTGAIV